MEQYFGTEAARIVQYYVMKRVKKKVVEHTKDFLDCGFEIDGIIRSGLVSYLTKLFLKQEMNEVMQRGYY